ncbi:hypothetical protein [Candidatus Dactylopiibacterium carminicum]|nr:hypothetical protein [Candidatus Dactylopiibacterium carminicum]
MKQRLLSLSLALGTLLSPAAHALTIYTAAWRPKRPIRVPTW